MGACVLDLEVRECPVRGAAHVTRQSSPGLADYNVCAESAGLSEGEL